MSEYMIEQISHVAFWFFKNIIFYAIILSLSLFTSPIGNDRTSPVSR